MSDHLRSPDVYGLSRPMRVLVVDDEALNVQLVQAMLARVEGVQTVATTDPTKATALFTEHPPDLVLLDLHMPSMSGLEVMGALGELVAPDDFVPVIVLTADVDPRARTAALEAGAHDFLVKPLDVTDVVLRVRNTLRTRALHVHLEGRRAELAEQLREHGLREEAAAERRRTLTERISRVVADRAITMAFQPIADLRDGRVVGVEALSRFSTEPVRGPDVWFAEAHEVGLGSELEMTAVRLALDALEQVPPGVFVSVNLSPENLAGGGFEAALDGHPGERIVVELTEHEHVEDYDALKAVIERMRRRGVRLAVDDAGAGFASLQHILRLEPDIIKLDLALTRDIDSDAVRRALASSLVTFAHEVGAEIVAEGIETPGEQSTLSALGIELGQGYHLARPGPLPIPSRLGTER